MVGSKLGGKLGSKRGSTPSETSNARPDPKNPSVWTRCLGKTLPGAGKIPVSEATVAKIARPMIRMIQRGKEDQDRDEEDKEAGPGRLGKKKS